MKKVLLVKLSALGDVIFTIPLANTLKANGWEVHWLTTEKGFDILDGNPCADKVHFLPMYTWRKNKLQLKYLFQMFKVLFDLRKEKFDIAFDCQRRIKSLPFMRFCGAKRRIISKHSTEGAKYGANEILSTSPDSNHMVLWNLDYASYIGLDTSEIKMSLPTQPEKIKNKIDELTKDLDKTKPIVVLAPETTWVPKHWNIENWVKVAEALKDKCNIILTGVKLDTTIFPDSCINLVGKTNLKDLIELFSRVDLVIAPDSGSAHIAWASAKPALIEIFCCTWTEFFGCFGNDKKYFTMTGNLACQPCGQRKCPDKDNPNACANLPKPDEVINKALEILF